MNKTHIENTYEFKLICKQVKKQFKWITDCIVSEEQSQYLSTPLIGFMIDPILACNINGWKINDYIKEYSETNFTYSGFLMFVFDISTEEENDIRYEIKKIIKNVIDSSAIPYTYKIQDRDDVEIDDFYINFNDYDIPNELFEM